MDEFRRRGQDMLNMAGLTVEVVTNERVVYSQEDVDMVVAPGTAGTMAVLPHHAPLVTTLAGGELRVVQGGNEQSMVVFGGFMEVTPEKVIVLADVAENVEEIDLSRAEEARKRAESEIASAARSTQAEDLQTAQAAMRRASVRLRVAERRRGSRRRSDTSAPPGM